MDPSIANLAKTYVAYLHSDDAALQWASDEVMDLSMEGPWERLWQLIQAIVALPDEPELEVLAYIAAGPLEDLLDKAGPDYISAVEELARSNARAARMLTGVWQSSMHPAVWQRVVTFCRNVPDPIDGVYRY